MIRKFVTLLLCLLPVTFWGQEIHQHQHEENSGTGLAAGEIFSPFRNNPIDSTNSTLKVPKNIRQWHVDEHSGEIIPVNADTLQFMYQNWHLTEGMNGEYNFLGNMGTPRQSRIFFNRPTDTRFDFLQPFDYFYTTPDRFLFTDTKSPYTNLTYHSSGNQIDGDDRFRAYFSTNAGKHFGAGFLFDYLYARGRYDNQASSQMNFSLFSFYRSDRYNYHLLASHYHIKQAENGGITDDRYITRPEETDGANSNFGTSDIPVRLEESWSRNEVYDLFFTHHYNLGFYREKLTADSTGTVKDSTEQEFVSVSRITHTADIKHHRREFISHVNHKGYFADTYLPYDSLDRSINFTVGNRVALSLCEGFSRWAFADITAYAAYRYNNYSIPDTIPGGKEFGKEYSEHIISVVGIIESKLNEHFKYRVEGETAFGKGYAGSFDINGTAEAKFNLWNREFRVGANAYLKNNLPSFFYRHYHSEHYWWDNDLDKEFRTRIEGKIEIPGWKTRLSVGFENIMNYTYIANDSEQLPGTSKYLSRLSVKQESGSTRVFSASLKQDFTYGILNLNTEITYQHSSNQNILPLPALNLYANLFLKFRIAKVLNTEIGTDVRYFTKYYAPDYSPALGQFVQQNPGERIEIGNYPLASVYANFLLKQTRFYVKYSHWNEGLGNRNYFLVPHHPMNPDILWFGLSWNFYN